MATVAPAPNPPNPAAPTPSGTAASPPPSISSPPPQSSSPPPTPTTSPPPQDDPTPPPPSSSQPPPPATPSTPPPSDSPPPSSPPPSQPSNPPSTLPPPAPPSNPPTSASPPSPSPPSTPQPPPNSRPPPPPSTPAPDIQPPPASTPPESSPPPPETPSRPPTSLPSPPRNSPPLPPPPSIPPRGAPPPPNNASLPPTTPTLQPPPSGTNSTQSTPPPVIRLAPPPPSRNTPSSSSPPSSVNNETIPNAPSDQNGGDGGIGTGAIVGIGVTLGILMLTLIGVIAWCIKKRGRSVSRVNGDYVVPSPFASSPISDSSYTKTQSTTAPLMGSGSSSDFISSPAEPGGLMHSRSLFTYEEMVTATNGFSSQNLLGEGGFGCVYKGCLPDGREVAVKQLNIHGSQGEREFKAEVDIISRVHHRHLVSLVGYCISDSQRLLVYEYVPNNTLDFHLHEEGIPVLDWPHRIKIAVGAARGLAYLHQDCHPRIIHRDIKSSNILLDNNFEAKVSDFGLAKLNPDAYTHLTTRVMGTYGYVAPEYATSGKLSEKSDVYSFGVVLLELITGQKPLDPSQSPGKESLVERARPFLSHALVSGELGGLIDPRLDKNYVEEEMFRMIEAAAACVRHSAAKRPRMEQIVRALGDIAAADLTNGMKIGESEIVRTPEESEQFRLMQRMAFGGQDFSSALPPMAAMEDCNQMAADCVVLSCCCQCLLLQFLIYLFLKLPRRLLNRTRNYARKKLLKMRSRKKIETELVGRRTAKFGEMFADIYNNEGSMCIDIGLLEEFKKSNADNDNIIEHLDMGEDRHQCIEEIERVFDECHAKGEFGFGSFWRKEVSKMGSPSSSSSSSSFSPSSSPISWGRSRMASPRSSHNSTSSSTGRSSGGAKKQRKKKESGGFRAVQFELIEIVHSLSRSSYGSFQTIDKLLDYERSPSGIWRNPSAS
ncbi:unnamed protein product [Linum tenue]|uniref:non-specific serine/threonine protein kinase n=1 Tax=Linum tenue TaxID=586396 RepID=A0AAV0R4S3_9ROSI|nr:unnamed protein product [Linum tenue]